MTGILTQAEQHTVQVQRLATRLLNTNVYPSLTEAYKAARLILLDAGEITSITQLNKITRDINKAVIENMNNGWAATTQGLDEFALYEASFYASLIGSTSDVDLTVPAETKIANFIKKSLLSLQSGSKATSGTWAQLVNQNTLAMVKDYDNAVRASFANSETVNQAAARLKTVTEGLSKNEATSLARTGIQHYAVQAHEAVHEENKAVIKAYEYVAVLDNRTTTLCGGRDGNQYRKGEKRPELPAHFNCLTEDTNVSTCSAISNVYKRAFKGELVKIVTKSGRTIKITPNHPVFTSRGWVAAKDINLTDKVVCINDSGFLRKNYKKSVNAKFGELFSSVNVLVDPASVGVRPTTAKDFHGDVSDTNVEIVNINSHTWDRVRKSFNEGVKNKRLVSRSFIKQPLHGLSSFYLGFMRNLSACCGNIGLFSERCFFALRTPVHSSLLLFRPVSGFVSSLANNISKGCCATFYSKVPAYSRKSDTSKEGSNNPFLGSIINVVKSIFSGDKLPNDPPRNINADSDGFSDFILSHIGSGCQLDDVVDCSLFSFSGHVYNLENKDNWYTSNDIITHNCRSQYLAIVIGEDDLEGRRTAVGGRKGESAKDAYSLRKDRKRTDGKVKRRGRKDDSFFDPSQVNAKTNYQKWFIKQPVWWQESAIGKTRASLVRNGGMKISKFNDMTGRQLSLDELKILDKEAFAKAGL